MRLRQLMIGGASEVLQVSGTELTSNTPAEGRLCLVPGPQVQLQNRLGSDVDVVVTLFWR